jgi:hypothetical protein
VEEGGHSSSLDSSDSFSLIKKRKNFHFKDRETLGFESQQKGSNSKPESIAVDPNPDPHCLLSAGSGSRRTKMAHIHRKND